MAPAPPPAIGNGKKDVQSTLTDTISLEVLSNHALKITRLPIRSYLALVTLNPLAVAKAFLTSVELYFKLLFKKKI